MINNKNIVSDMANRSISISLDDQLLARLDAQGSNRSALVSEALTLWLAQRQIQDLEQAYAHLAQLEEGDVGAAGHDAAAMAEAALGPGSHG